MAEYIEREALLNRLEAIKESADWDSQSKYVLFGIKEFINNAPAADVVEVVRCKECRFYETDVEYYGGGTKDVCRLLKRQMQCDDFCSYGERKENNNV